MTYDKNIPIKINSSGLGLSITLVDTLEDQSSLRLVKILIEFRCKHFAASWNLLTDKWKKALALCNFKFLTFRSCMSTVPLQNDHFCETKLFDGLFGLWLGEAPHKVNGFINDYFSGFYSRVLEKR